MAFTAEEVMNLYEESKHMEYEKDIQKNEKNGEIKESDATDYLIILDILRDGNKKSALRSFTNMDTFARDQFLELLQGKM